VYIRAIKVLRYNLQKTSSATLTAPLSEFTLADMQNPDKDKNKPEMDCYGVLYDSNLLPCASQCAVRVECKAEVTRWLHLCGKEEKKKSSLKANKKRSLK